eukprot:snap_masked-scaffold_44-processed-gene-1.38-mRNA-1 protein AED:0.04 eAED:0.04 QI:0/0/0/1/1/1/2/0/407
MRNNQNKNMNKVKILAFKRTPMASFGSVYSHLSAIQLGIHSTNSLFSSLTNVFPRDVDDVYLGNVLSSNLGQAPAKQVSLGAGIPPSVPCTTINKVCSSSLKALEISSMQIQLGLSDLILTGGFESMSSVPRYLTNSRFSKGNKKYGDIKINQINNLDKKSVEIIDGLAKDGLGDPFTREQMGQFGVLAAVENKITREEQDEWALNSYKRAFKAHKEGKFSNEIVSIPGIDLQIDEETLLRGENMTKEKISSLPFAFKIPKEKQNLIKTKEDEKFSQSVTAGNSSTMSDGAISMLVASDNFCKQKQLTPLANIIIHTQSAQIPERFTTSPILAVEKALNQSGIRKEKVNIYGGACALGHPLGMSGVRIVGSLISVLKQEGGRLGCAVICNGGGGSSCVIIENVISKL